MDRGSSTNVRPRVRPHYMRASPPRFSCRQARACSLRVDCIRASKQSYSSRAVNTSRPGPPAPSIYISYYYNFRPRWHSCRFHGKIARPGLRAPQTALESTVVSSPLRTLLREDGAIGERKLHAFRPGTRLRGHRSDGSVFDTHGDQAERSSPTSSGTGNFQAVSKMHTLRGGVVNLYPKSRGVKPLPLPLDQDH